MPTVWSGSRPESVAEGLPVSPRRSAVGTVAGTSRALIRAPWACEPILEHVASGRVSEHPRIVHAPQPGRCRCKAWIGAALGSGGRAPPIGIEGGWTPRPGIDKQSEGLVRAAGAAKMDNPSAAKMDNPSLQACDGVQRTMLMTRHGVGTALLTPAVRARSRPRRYAGRGGSVSGHTRGLVAARAQRRS